MREVFIRLSNKEQVRVAVDENRSKSVKSVLRISKAHEGVGGRWNSSQPEIVLPAEILPELSKAIQKLEEKLK